MSVCWLANCGQAHANSSNLFNLWVLQVWPVLCAGRGSHKAQGINPSVTLSMHVNPFPSSNPPSGGPSRGPSRPTSRPGNAALSSGGAATAVASIQLRPSTVWLSLPLLQRLQAFFEPLTNVPSDAEQARYA